MPWCGQLEMVKQTKSSHQTYNFVSVQITLKNIPLLMSNGLTTICHPTEDCSLKMKGKCMCVTHVQAAGCNWCSMMSQVKGVWHF